MNAIRLCTYLRPASSHAPRPLTPGEMRCGGLAAAQVVLSGDDVLSEAKAGGGARQDAGLDSERWGRTSAGLKGGAAGPNRARRLTAAPPGLPPPRPGGSGPQTRHQQRVQQHGRRQHAGPAAAARAPGRPSGPATTCRRRGAPPPRHASPTGAGSPGSPPPHPAARRGSLRFQGAAESAELQEQRACYISAHGAGPARPP